MSAALLLIAALLQPAPGAERHPQVDRLSEIIAPELADPEGLPGFGAPAAPKAGGLVVDTLRVAASAGRPFLQVALQAQLTGEGPRLLLVDAELALRDPRGKLWIPIPGQQVPVRGGEGWLGLDVLAFEPGQQRPVPNMPLKVLRIQDPGLLAVLREARRIAQVDGPRLAPRVALGEGGQVSVNPGEVGEDAMLAGWLEWRAGPDGAPTARFPQDALQIAVFALTVDGDEGAAVEWLREARGLRVGQATDELGRLTPPVEHLLTRVGLNAQVFSAQHADHHFNLGLRRWAVGDAAGALAAFEQAASKAPDDVEARYAVGVAAYRAGKHQDAADAFLVAGGMKGAFVETHYNRAAALYRLGDRLGAARSLRKVLAMNPEDRGALAWLAVADPEGRTAPPPAAPPAPRKRR